MVSRYKISLYLDSGLRRNDGKEPFWTSNEVVEFVAHRVPQGGINQLFTSSSTLVTFIFKTQNLMPISNGHNTYKGRA